MDNVPGADISRQRRFSAQALPGGGAIHGRRPVSVPPQLSGVPDCYWKPEGSGRSLAVPIDDGRPFLLPRYFCFARIERLWGKAYAVFAFDEAGQPILP